MKHITLDNANKQNLIDKFTAYINNAKLTNNQINFFALIDKPDEENIVRPTVYISAEAYLKMMLYVRDSALEIAWHGTVMRNRESNYYFIKDVFLYPQKVTGATVNTDQEEYNNWLIDLDDDTANELRFQGHSHVNMGVTPSGVDTTFYDHILQTLPKDDYYIFMIMNKSGDMTLMIYDLAANLIYDTEDIDVRIVTSTSQDLIRDIKKYKEEHIATFTYNTTPIKDSYKNYNSLSKKEVIKEFNKLRQYEDLPFPEDDEEYWNSTDSLFADLDTKYNKKYTVKSKKR